MIAMNILSTIGAVAFLIGCIAFHARLRTWASIARLSSTVACVAWTWLDSEIPYWNLGPSPIPHSLLIALFNAAPYTGPILYFSFGISFLATALSVARRTQVPVAGA